MDRVSLLEDEQSSSFRSCETAETDQTQEGSVYQSLSNTAVEGPSLDYYIDEAEEEIIFLKVFRLLDENSLRQARLVCRRWNNFALQIMSKTPGNVEFIIENAEGFESEDIGQLQSILRTAEYPEMFFQQLTLDLYNCILEGDNKLVSLLQESGSILKSLTLTNVTLNLCILRPMLEMCENLEELSLNDISVTEDMTVQDFETLPTPLKLKLRKFEVFVNGEEDSDENEPQPNPAAGNLIVSIIKSSPKLKVLGVEILPGQADFWRNLQNIPEITNNLVEVRIEGFGYGMEDISLLNDVSFSNITSLKINIRDPIFPQEQLFTFLEKVGQSLEILHLYISSEGDQRPSWKIEFPSMSKLKVLEYQVYGHNMLVDESSGMDFRKKLPKLEILRLSRWRSTVPSEFLDNLNLNSFRSHPQTTLNTLSITGSSINPIGIGNPENIFQINRMFPTLRTLTLQFNFQSCQNSESRKESWLIRVFTGFSEMKNLKILDLTFPNSLPWSNTINFKACFSPLEASKSLEELKIKRVAYDDFPSGLEKVFVSIPKLKVLTLENFRIKILPESLKLFKALDQKGILLKSYQTCR